nr:hypothetical protein [uncultured Faecalibacillus sp.]
MFNGFDDYKCQYEIDLLTNMMKKKKKKLKIITGILIFLTLILFSETTVSVGYESTTFRIINLGFLNAPIAILLIVLWIFLYNVSKSLYQSVLARKIDQDFIDNDCDPLAAQFVYRILMEKKVFNEQAVLENYVGVLTLLGEQQTIKRLLNKYPKSSINTANKEMIEFSLLSEEEKYHKISNYYRKMQMIFDSLSKKVKKESDQKILEQNRLDLEILNSFYHREYKKTLDLIEKNTVDSLLKRVLFAKLEAKSYYYLKDTSKAKEKLEFIIEKGNTMFVVEQAKEMLKEF